MEDRTILFIEGEPNSPNGDLRQGFSKLLSQKLEGNLPRIILGGGKKQTVDKFKNNKLTGKQFLLLVDLDNPASEIENDLQSHNLFTEKEQVFFMIQEMEAWFISQPAVLDVYFGIDAHKKKISDKLPKKEATSFSNPDEELQKHTKDSRKGSYHKIKHAIDLLKLLDANQLTKDFPEFARLIARLK